MAKRPAIPHAESDDQQKIETLSLRSIIAFRSFLHSWYTQYGRSLPWRETRDPYRIWVSEIILQQTQVVQGHDYYLRFIDKYPTVADLARADEDELMLLWQGLGYYSRAHNMKVAAQQIMEHMGGEFPDTPDGVRSLKGVGPYTTAAIMSIAYDYPLAAVDGNVYRILSRLLATETPIDTTAGIHFYAHVAQTFLDPDNPGLYNQAMMDLGAIVCTPQSPSCLTCPVQTLCQSRGTELVQLLPLKSKRTAVTERYLDYFCMTSAGQMIVERRPMAGIWKGLYQLPLLERTDRPSTDDELREYLNSQWHITDSISLPLHRLTHRLLHIRVHLCTPTSGFILPDDVQTIVTSEHNSLSFPKPLRAFLDSQFPPSSKDK